MGTASGGLGGGAKFAGGAAGVAEDVFVGRGEGGAANSESVHLKMTVIEFNLHVPCAKMCDERQKMTECRVKKLAWLMLHLLAHMSLTNFQPMTPRHLAQETSAVSMTPCAKALGRASATFTAP